MDEEEAQKKTMALKKAYAEVMLNTAKEAAARVMVSERKAVGFQKDLHSTKEEALRLLLRFKQMFDSRTSEAEVTYLNQSKRIAELEAQLNETEMTILDLRAELRQTYDQLDTVKNNNVHLSGFNEKDEVLCCDTVNYEDQQITSALTSSPQFNKCHNLTKQTPKEIVQVENFFDDDPNLSSVILKNKEPELYRNGCTQRIRAFERNLLDEKLSYGNLADQPMPIKCDTFDNEHEHNVETCALFSFSGDMDVVKNPVGSVKFPDNSTTVKDQPVKTCILQRKKSRKGISKATLRRLHRHKAPKIRQTYSDISHQKHNSTEGNKIENSGVKLPQHKRGKMNLVEKYSKLDKRIQCDNGQAVFVPRRSLRKRKARYQDDDIDPSSVPPFLSRCKMNSINHESTSDLDCLETESKTEIDEETNIVLASRCVTAEVKLDRDPKPGHNAECKDATFIDESEVVKNNGNAAKSIWVANELSTISNSFGAKTDDATNGAPSHVDGSSDTATDLVECSSEGQTRAEEKVDMNESSRESRRLAQVARQLISLSGKRW